MTQRLDISERAEGVDILAPARTAQRELPHLSVEAEGVLCVDASGVDSVCSGAENTRAAGAGLAFLGDTQFDRRRDCGSRESGKLERSKRSIPFRQRLRGDGALRVPATHGAVNLWGGGQGAASWTFAHA